ncbi:MAG: hypothetical protein QM704_00055 [Anaeromyxobacteraceae bacterium]
MNSTSKAPWYRTRRQSAASRPARPGATGSASKQMPVPNLARPLEELRGRAQLDLAGGGREAGDRVDGLGGAHVERLDHRADDAGLGPHDLGVVPVPADELDVGGDELAGVVDPPALHLRVEEDLRLRLHHHRVGEPVGEPLHLGDVGREVGDGRLEPRLEAEVVQPPLVEEAVDDVHGRREQAVVLGEPVAVRREQPGEVVARRVEHHARRGAADLEEPLEQRGRPRPPRQALAARHVAGPARVGDERAVGEHHGDARAAERPRRRERAVVRRGREEERGRHEADPASYAGAGPRRTSYELGTRRVTRRGRAPGT